MINQFDLIGNDAKRCASLRDYTHSERSSFTIMLFGNQFKETESNKNSIFGSPLRIDNKFQNRMKSIGAYKLSKPQINYANGHMRSTFGTKITTGTKLTNHQAHDVIFANRDSLTSSHSDQKNNSNN